MNARLALALLLGAIIGGTWWIGAREVPAQVFVASFASLAALFAAIGATRSEERGRFSPMAAVVLAMMLAFLGLQLAQVANPSFAVQMDGLCWRRIPLPHSRLLPTGFEAPFDRTSRNDISLTNPARHLLIFGSAACATVAAFLATRQSSLQRALLAGLTIHGTAVALVTIAHDLTGSTKALWIYSEMEFWNCSAFFPCNNAGAAAQVLLLGCTLALLRIERERESPSAARISLLVIAAALSLVAILLLGSRGGAAIGLALALIGAVGELRNRQARRPRWALPAAAVLAVGAAFLLWSGGFAKTVGRFRADLGRPLTLLRGGEQRILKQQIALEMAKDHLWFGAGGGAYLYLFLDYHPRVPAYLRDLLAAQPDRNRIYETSVDGDWWEFLVEYGIVGTSLLAGSILGALLLWRRSGGTFTSASGYLASAAALVTIHGAIDRTLREPIVLASLGVTLSLAIRTARRAARPRLRRPLQDTPTPGRENPQSSASE